MVSLFIGIPPLPAHFLPPRVWWSVAALLLLPRLQGTSIPNLAAIAGLPEPLSSTNVPAGVVFLRGFSAGNFSAAWLDVLARRLGISGATVVGAVAMPPNLLRDCTVGRLAVTVACCRSFRAIHADADSLCFWSPDWNLDELAKRHVLCCCFLVKERVGSRDIVMGIWQRFFHGLALGSAEQLGACLALVQAVGQHQHATHRVRRDAKHSGPL